MEVNWQNSFPKKYCHTYEFPHTYGSIFFRMPAFLSEKLFYSCRLLGLMQTIHTSAVRCCFCRIKCYFPKIVAAIFFFCCLPYNTPPFHFNCKYSLFCRFFPFNVEIPTQHVIFPRNYFHTDIRIVYPLELPLYVYLIYSLSLLVYFKYLCKNDT